LIGLFERSEIFDKRFKEQRHYHPRTVLQINRIAYLALAPLLQVFPKSRKMREDAKIILLEDHKMSERPCQALEQNVIKLRIWNDE